MSYETGTSTGPDDMLDKIRIFAIAEGWTVNRWVTANTGHELCINNGDNYINMRSVQGETFVNSGVSATNRYAIAINGSDGYDDADDWGRQTGYPRRDVTVSNTDQYASMMPFVTTTGPFVSYHLFSHKNGRDIHLELEISTGIYLRLGFGKLDTYNASASGGGRFFYASGALGNVSDSIGNNQWLGETSYSANSLEECPFTAGPHRKLNAYSGSCVRVAFDSFDGWATSGSTNVSAETGVACRGGLGLDEVILQLTANPINNIAILTPINVDINDSNAFMRPLGVMYGVRYMLMDNYLSEDEFSLGGDTWKVFPWYNLNGRSANLGITHLKES